MSVSVSVIIPTFNGAHKIVNLIDALKSQTFAKFEVIVVVDGSTDNTSEVLKNNIGGLNAVIKTQTKNGGRSLARNFGADVATGGLLIFYDDDMVPVSDSIQRHVNFHNERKDAICGGNSLINKDRCDSDFQRYKLYMSNIWMESYNEGISRLSMKNLYLTSANVSIPTEVFKSLKGFDESLTDAEDYDLGVRALKEGHDIFLDTMNIAWHDDFSNCREYIIRRRLYEVATKKLFEVYVEKKIMMAPYDHKLPSVKYFFYMIVCQKYIVQLIDKEWLVWVFPVDFRYRLYSMIIWGLSKYFTNITL